MSGTQKLDPIQMAVIANRLNAIVREMANTLLRSARCWRLCGISRVPS